MLQSLEFEDDSRETGYHPEEPDSALVYFSANDDLGHVGASQGGDKIPY